MVDNEAFAFVMKFLYEHSRALEENSFANRTSDYAYFILVSMVLLLPLSFFFNIMLLGRPLVLSILYLWAKKYPDVEMSFYFGIKFKGFYLPWVLTGFEMLMGTHSILKLFFLVLFNI